MSCETTFAKDVEAETLVAALFFLTTRYALTQNTALIQPIMDHFNWLANHPNLVNTTLQNTCCRLQKTWLLMQKRNEVLSSSAAQNLH